MPVERQVIAYKRYFLDFYEAQSERTQRKIEWTLQMIRITRWVPEKYFKHISGTDGLYEIRVASEGNAYRIFSFFDHGNIIVLGNGFQKKSKRIPHTEIKKALKIMEEYTYEK